ncbi:VanZ family protein [Herbiconiux sp. 11R-BC]|uniref:VanZ family protein n=1 Tax=Herbiconiux sp. 11R-BC TaxID=3111637 RepID=UPI003C0F7449
MPTASSPRPSPKPSSPTPSRRHARPIAAGLLIAYSLVVLLIVAWPTPVDAPSHSTLLALLRAVHKLHVLMFINYAQVEFLANVAMFVPLGLLIGVLFGRHRWGFAVLICFGVSSLIETAQFFLLPGRYGTVDDVIANTLGALVGALLARAWLRRRAD